MSNNGGRYDAHYGSCLSTVKLKATPSVFGAQLSVTAVLAKLLFVYVLSTKNNTE